MLIFIKFFFMTQEGGESLPSFNFEAKESSKEEECAAICKLRGVDADSAPIALQLKAIDEEYHHLVGSGQSGKADHVQGLFLWKSKQASQVRKGFFLLHSNLYFCRHPILSLY